MFDQEQHIFPPPPPIITNHTTGQQINIFHYVTYILSTVLVCFCAAHSSPDFALLLRVHGGAAFALERVGELATVGEDADDAKSVENTPKQ